MTTAEPPVVYIVDDDDAVRRSLADVIRLFEFRVETFASAAEFLAAYERGRRGCLILDVRLAAGSGIDLHADILSDGINLPTIFVTGHAPPPITQEARSRGVVAVFQKPFRPQDLVEVIRRALDTAHGGHGPQN